GDAGLAVRGGREGGVGGRGAAEGAWRGSVRCVASVAEGGSGKGDALNFAGGFRQRNLQRIRISVKIGIKGRSVGVFIRIEKYRCLSLELVAGAGIGHQLFDIIPEKVLDIKRVHGWMVRWSSVNLNGA